VFAAVPPSSPLRAAPAAQAAVPRPPSCPCPAARACGLPAADRAGQWRASRAGAAGAGSRGRGGIRARPGRAHQREGGWGARGGTDAGGGKGRLIFLYSTGVVTDAHEVFASDAEFDGERDARQAFAKAVVKAERDAVTVPIPRKRHRKVQV
jgi:hypothetical protein